MRGGMPVLWTSDSPCWLRGLRSTLSISNNTLTPATPAWGLAEPGVTSLEALPLTFWGTRSSAGPCPAARPLWRGCPSSGASPSFSSLSRNSASLPPSVYQAACFPELLPSHWPILILAVWTLPATLPSPAASAGFLFLSNLNVWCSSSSSAILGFKLMTLTLTLLDSVEY